MMKITELQNPRVSLLQYNQIFVEHPSLAPTFYVRNTIIEAVKKEGLDSLFKLSPDELKKLVFDGCSDARNVGHSDYYVTQKYVDDASKIIVRSARHSRKSYNR